MKFFLAILLLFILNSCGESFKEVNTKKFNAKLTESKNLKTPEEVILLFYNYPSNESQPKLEIFKKVIGKNQFELTLIHDNQGDDSQKAEKVIMILEKTESNWVAKKILRNWKCYSGRGHTSWGIEPCD